MEYIHNFNEINIVDFFISQHINNDVHSTSQSIYLSVSNHKFILDYTS